MLNKDIVFVYDKLCDLREDASFHAPARLAFAVARNLRILKPIVEDYTVSRVTLLKQYGTTDPDNPNQVSIPADKLEQVQQQLSDLDSMDIKVQCEGIKMQDVEGLELSISAAEALEFFIEEEI